MSEISSKISKLDLQKSEKNKNSLDNYYGKRKCKTSGSKKSQNNQKHNISDIAKNLRNFIDYLKEIKIYYENEFKNSEKIKNNPEIKDIFDIKNEFKRVMPYISGAKQIELTSIKIPDKQFFMYSIFQDIINSFQLSQTYPGEDKCGLVYFKDAEWIYYTIEEIYFQRYITNTQNIMSRLYEDFMKNELNSESLFTEDDKYILPSSISGYNFERNAAKYFQMKTGLATLPDLLLILDPESKNNNLKKELTFDEYFKSMKYTYIEIDGAFINNTNENIKLKNDENVIIPYDKIIVDKFEKQNFYSTKISKNCNDTIDIPDKTVIILQTKMKSP